MGKVGEAGQELQAKGPLVEGAHEPKGRKEARHLKRRAGHAAAKDFGLVLRVPRASERSHTGSGPVGFVL